MNNLIHVQAVEQMINDNLDDQNIMIALVANNASQETAETLLRLKALYTAINPSITFTQFCKALQL